MSFEAIAGCRPHGTRRDFIEKWLTVPIDCRETAIRMFHDLGYDIRGLQILTQEEANERVQKRWPSPAQDTVQAGT
jgi:hypothetical protein